GSAMKAATVKWTAVNGAAVAGADFGRGGVPSGTLSWGVQDGSPRTITIPVVNDSAYEGPETFTVVLSDPGGASLGEFASFTVTSAKAETPPQSSISFVEPKVLVLESAGTATLTLHRELIGAAFTAPVTVSYVTQAGTALASSDFTSKTGTVTWA